ncbi:putative aldouronate transport system permease protein [Paenibacillus algorifonticola]|uniref:Putative aldouronate transport system permease protein n=1 Tax=Paenibacillus algorifonticola TaxID=684063 RepID=A0A1I2GVH8_9BACL|nr:ABC transporter permease subunit [Paenibacillus algorifonticola]SFF21140.1 putative aldouronate transport system permease protein [Paenibacillus algorifonticola]
MRAQNMWRQIRKDKILYVMVIPGILYFFVFDYIPMYGVLMAFKDYSIFEGFMDSDWVGLANFQQLFNTYGFTRALRNTIIISIYQLVFAFPIPILLAILLNELRSVLYQRFVQTAIYLPHFVSWVIIGGIMFAILSPSTGVIYEIASFFGYEGKVTNFLNSKEYFRGLLVVSNIWKEAGFGTVLYMATIATINPQQYEAAKVDGAGKLRQMWHVTLPGLRTTIVILLIFRVGQLLNAGLEQVFALYSPLVYEVSEILDTYVYKLAFNEAKFALATATGVFKALVCLVLVLITNYIAKKIDSESGLF